MKKNIIFINQETGPLLIDMINHCVKNDVNAVLYTGKVIKTYADLDDRVKIRNLCTYRKDNAFNRITSWSIFFSQSLLCLIFDIKKDTYLWISSNPPMAPWLNFFFKNKTFVHIFDVYPNALLALPNINKESFIYRVFLKLNKKCFNKAEKIFTPSLGMKMMLEEACISEKIEVINWWANTEFIKPIPKENNIFSKKHNIQDKFVVMYSGNFGLTHNIEKMIAASEAMASYQDIIFLIIGGGPKQEVVKKYISATKAKNLIYLPFQNEDMLPYTLTSADIAVVLDSFSANPGSTSTASIPSKTFYLMAAGNAIYAESDDSSELSRIINHFEIGFCDKSQSLENFIKFIKNCYSDRLLLNKLKENSRNASANFSDKKAALLYESIYQNCEDNSLM